MSTSLLLVILALNLIALYLSIQKKGSGGNEKNLIEAIEKNIRFWDYRRRWSRYGCHRFLCTPVYNKLNSALLRVLYEITAKDIFHDYSSAWDPEKLPLGAMLEILIAFVITRNAWRICNWGLFPGRRDK